MWKSKSLLGVAAIAFGWLMSGCGDDLATPSAGQPSDMEIVAAVEAEYLLHPNIDRDAINVASDNGVVTLAGTVDDLLAETRAVEIVEATRGVRSVVNQIQVTPPARSDEAIRLDAFQALLDDPATESYEIDVAVNDGIVTLSGSVDSWAERDLAQDVVAGVLGVRSISNNLTIEYKERGDTEISAEIRRRLQSDVMVDAGLINVDVNAGILELSGTAGSLAEKRRAVHDAYVNGVIEVSADDVEIEWWARDEMRRTDRIVDLTDEEVRNAVVAALAYDPRVIDTTIEVSADGGLVTLKGTVGSMREEQAAIEDAQNTYGVWDVVDSLYALPSDALTDQELEEMVQNAFERDPFVEGLEVVVEVLDGTAYLTGAVDNTFEKLHAEQIASSLKNIVAVENSIDILEETLRVDDSAMEEQIRQKLLWNPWLSYADLEVQVSNGVVNISGTVDNRVEITLLEQIAEEVGAHAVEIDVSVDNWPSPPNIGVDIAS